MAPRVKAIKRPGAIFAGMRAIPPSALPAALALMAAVTLPVRSAPSPALAPRTASTAPSEAPPTLHLRIGADSNACGISLPAGGAPKGGKAGLIVWLHGGMRSPNREKGLDAHRGWLAYLPARRYYVCSPSAYGGADWLTPQGLGHIEALIKHMLKAYRIDPGDISMVGVSDGSLGVIAYSLQGRWPLRHRVLISSAPQLVLPLENLAGQARFAQGTWDFVQGGKDRLFPADQVMPYLDRFHTLYPNAQVHAFPEGEHDFSWYAEHEPALLRSFFAKADQKPAQSP
jgi:pimeloyl-ACP methyl ester carboxylesterase